MLPIFVPLPGTASTATDLANVLGRVYEIDGIKYRLVKAEGAIAAAAKLTVATLLSSNVPTWVVDLPGTTGAAVTNPVGVIPVGQKGSTGTTGLIANDYFLVQISGVATCISAGTLAAGDGVGPAGTAGKVDTTTSLATAIGHATNAATDSSTDVTVLLKFLPQ